MAAADQSSASAPELSAQRRGPWRRWLLRRVISLAIIFAGVLVLLTLFQSRFVYHPRRDLESTPEEVGLNYQDVQLTAADGVKLHGWWVPHPSPRATVLLLHGNAGNISHRTDLLRFLHECGVDVLIIDYRGYGRSEGKPTENGTYADAMAAWRYLLDERGVSPGRIVLHGRSLGGAVATWLAMQVEPAGLIVESSFTSARDMASQVLPVFPTFLVRFKYNSINRIGEIDCPLLVIHSRDDDLVPHEQGRRLYEAARQPKRFVELEGGHNDGYLLSIETYTAALNAFFAGLAE
ncbi:MAG: alpha/beta hydrolase [Phycisphaerae bacterium]|nr:alpha/beta hydrolase [Phycisphaerae bacterium]